jgi:hypothetical protein
MDALVRHSADLAYTTYALRALDSYVPWGQQSAMIQHAWCEALEVARAYALTQLTQEEPPHATA